MIDEKKPRPSGRGAFTFEVYRDHEQQWRWRLRAATGEVVSIGVEGYERKVQCLDCIYTIKQAAAAEVVVEHLEDDK